MAYLHAGLLQVGAMCLACAAFMGSAGKAVVLLNLLLLIFVLFSGFLANKVCT
jgi:hypothetical protein